MPGKLQKFSEVNSFENCFYLGYPERDKGLPLRGMWRKEFFKNEHPVVLELGCGRGEYTIGLAKNSPQKNFIGVDIKGNRIWTGAKEALDCKLNNVAFVRTRIDFIEHCFEKGEVSEIWITFPDPQPQKPRERKRLTNMRFIDRYRKFLKPGGYVHLKTDNTGFYEYTLEVIQENKLNLIFHTNDLYTNCPIDRQELIQIKTHYEKLFTARGEKIKYILFQIN